MGFSKDMFLSKSQLCLGLSGDHIVKFKQTENFTVIIISNSVDVLIIFFLQVRADTPSNIDLAGLSLQDESVPVPAPRRSVRARKVFFYHKILIWCFSHLVPKSLLISKQILHIFVVELFIVAICTYLLVLTAGLVLDTAIQSKGGSFHIHINILFYHTCSCKC